MEKITVSAEAFETIDSFCSYMSHWKERHVKRHERDCLQLYKVLNAACPNANHPALDFLLNANLWDLAQPASTWFEKDAA